MHVNSLNEKKVAVKLITAYIWWTRRSHMARHIYASPSSGEAYRDRQLTPNFELWVEIFCVPTCFHVRIPKPCLFVCPYPEKKKNHHSFVDISPTLVIDTSMERSSRVLQHGTPPPPKKKKKKKKKINAYLSVSAVMFCKQFLACTVQIDWRYHSIHKHSSRSQHAPIWWHRGCIVVPSRVDI